MQMNPKRKHSGYRIAQIATGALVVAALAASFTIWFQGESVLAQGQAFCQRCLRLCDDEVILKKA